MLFYKKIYKQKSLLTVSNTIIKDLDKLEINYGFVECIYNPFDFDAIRAKVDNTQINDVPSEYLISASAFRYVKRHDVLLDAYKHLNTQIKLVLLCDKNKKLLKMIKERNLQDKIIVTGFKTNPYPYIKNAKCLILSSEREGLPTVLIESLILGTPVVSTDCISGPSEILIGSLSKYLAKVNDFNDLSNKIEELLKDELLIIEEKYIDKFHEKNVLKKYLSLIN